MLECLPIQRFQLAATSGIWQHRWVGQPQTSEIQVSETETHRLREGISNQVKVEKMPPVPCEKNKKHVLCRWPEAWEDAGGQSVCTVLCWESGGNASVRGKYYFVGMQCPPTAPTAPHFPKRHE